MGFMDAISSYTGGSQDDSGQYGDVLARYLKGRGVPPPDAADPSTKGMAGYGPELERFTPPRSDAGSTPSGGMPPSAGMNRPAPQPSAGPDPTAQSGSMIRSAMPPPQPLQYDSDKINRLLAQKQQQEQPLNKQDPQYHLGFGGRLLRAGTDLLSGGIPGALRSAIDPNAPGYYGKGATNSKYSIDDAKRQKALANTTSDIADTYKNQEEQEKVFTGNRLLYHDTEMDAARQETADAKKRLADLQSGSVDPNSIEKNDESPTGFYGYAKGDTQRANPIPITPKGFQKQAPAPKTYEETVTAANLETDPARKAQLMAAAKQMQEAERRKFAAGNPRQSSEFDQIKAAKEKELGRPLTSDEMVALRSKAPAHTKDRATFELHWSKQLGPGSALERKYDAQRNQVLKAYGVDKDPKQYNDEVKAKLANIETERESEKAKLQGEKDAEAAQYNIYSPAAKPQQPAAPSKQAPQKQGAYTHFATNPKTGQRAGSKDGRTWFDVQTGKKL